MHYRCQREHFEKKQPFRKKYMFFWSFLNFQPVFFRKFDKNNSARVPNFIFCVYRGRVRAKNFFWKKNLFFDVRNFSNKKNGGGGDSPGEHFETFFGKTYSFYYRLCTLITIISEIFRTFSVLAKKFRRSCLKSSLPFHKNVWWFSFEKATFL